MATDPVIKHYFDVLGLKPTADKSAIKKAYMQKALQLHPDKCGNNTSEAAFKMIAQAWEVLSEHQVSASDVQGDAHSVGETGGHSADEVQALVRERDFLKRTVEYQVGINSSQASQLEQQHVAYEVLSDKQYLLEHKLEQEANLSNKRLLHLIDEQDAYARLLKERNSLSRTVYQQATENDKLVSENNSQAIELLQRDNQIHVLSSNAAVDAHAHGVQIFKLNTESQLKKLEAEKKIRMLELQLDDSLRFHDVLFFFFLVIVAFAVGAALSWSLSDGSDTFF